MWPEGGPVAVKVCGLTTPEDAAACARHGVWGIGVVFAEGSPRRVDAGQAARVLAAVPDRRRAGGRLRRRLRPRRWPTRPPLVGLTHLQVHGDADPGPGARA